MTGVQTCALPILDSAVRSAKKYKDLGEDDKYKQFLATDNKEKLISIQKELNIIARDLSNLRKYENKIYASRDTKVWTPESKKAELDRIEDIRQGMLGHQLETVQKRDRYIQQLREAGGL